VLVLTLSMIRREFLALTGGWASSAAIGLGSRPPARPGERSNPLTQPDRAADITLRIGEVTWELAPKRSIRTIAYNGQVPGPALRARAGHPVTVDVWNDTKDEDIVHWHGFHIPSDVDGAQEEGTPTVARNGGHRRYTFTPEPAGTRWYHSHIMAGRNLKKSTYTGQFGLFVIEAGGESGAYDQEVPLLLHEWDPHFSTQGPLDVEFRSFSINGKMSGAGEPVRVRPSQRVLFRIVNASATLHHRLALPRHQFLVTALDGNTVPSPKPVPIVDVAPGERVDALVEMNNPGVWILGEVRTNQRTSGMGIVVEYAGQSGLPRWEPPAPFAWDYSMFGGVETPPEPDGRLTMVFRATDDGHHWTINGKSHPRTDPIVVQPNKRYRWLLDNQSANDHPVHLHRHTFEVVRVAGQPMSGIWKDVVVVPAWKQVEVDVPTAHPGLSLFHCHQQFHMDMGFMTMVHYVP
jgi:FtsP/CotA-like multicopper oxidase with cupredoxin domain